MSYLLIVSRRKACNDEIVRKQMDVFSNEYIILIMFTFLTFRDLKYIIINYIMLNLNYINCIYEIRFFFSIKY